MSAPDFSNLARRGDVRYAALDYVTSGNTAYLPTTGAWVRYPGANPDEHEHVANAWEAIDLALRLPGVWILFCAENPNNMRDPYPDVVSERDYSGGVVLSIA